MNRPRTPDTSHTHWNSKRIARLGLLVGLGWDARRISEDPIIDSTPNTVHQRIHKLELSMREGQSFEMTMEAQRRFDTAASKRGLTRDALVKRLVHELANDPCLLNNVLDDQEG